MAEQRYKAVLAVIADGRTVAEVARDWGVSRQTMHAWLARYEADGREGLDNRLMRGIMPQPIVIERPKARAGRNGRTATGVRIAASYSLEAIEVLGGEAKGPPS